MQNDPIKLSKSVRHTCIFHKYLWNEKFVMSAKLAYELQGDIVMKYE